MYIPLSVLWILTVHKKYEDNSGFGCISTIVKGNCNCKRSCGLTHLYYNCSNGAERGCFFFAAVHKNLNTICSWIWLQFISSIGLHCVSLLAQLTSLWGTSLCIDILFFFLLAFYLIPPANIWLSPPFQLWFPGNLLKFEAVRGTESVTDNRTNLNLIGWPQLSQNQLKTQHFRFTTGIPNRCCNTPPTVSTGTRALLNTTLTSGFLNWHANDWLSSFSRALPELKCLSDDLSQPLPVCASTTELQGASRSNSLQVIPDTYARVLSISELHREENSVSKMYIYTQMWTVAGVGLVLRSNTGSFKCEKWPSVSLEQLASHLALRWISVVDGFSGHSGPTVFIRRPLHFAFHSHSAQSFLQESHVCQASTFLPPSYSQ